MIKISRIRKAEKVLFDTYRSQILVETVLGEKKWLGLDVRFDGKHKYLKLNVVSLVYAGWFFITCSKNYFPLSIGKRLVLSYLSSVIKLSGAREVYSLYGSTSVYYKHLTKIHFNLQFRAYITHQVHNRHLRDVVNSSNCFYYVMGSYDKEQIMTMGVAENQIQPIGSLYSRSYIDSSFFGMSIDPCDILLISQYQHYWELEDCSEIRIIAKRIFSRIVEFLSYILKENPSLNLVVALRPQPSKEAISLELAYFKSVFRENKNVTYLFNDSIKFSSYVALTNSRIVITHYSTLAFEALAFQTKVLFCQFYDYSSKFRIPDDVVHVCRDDSFLNFKEKLFGLMYSDISLDYFVNMKKRYNDI